MSTVLQGHIQRPALLCSLWGRISIICTWYLPPQRALFSNNNFHGLMNGQCFVSTYPLASHSKHKDGLDTLLEGNTPAAFPGDRPTPGDPSSAGAVTPSHIPSSPPGHSQFLCYPLQLFWCNPVACQQTQENTTRLWHPQKRWMRLSYSCEKIRASWRLEFPQLFIS